MNKESSPSLHYYLGKFYLVKKIQMGKYAVMNRKDNAIQSVWNNPNEAISVVKFLDKHPMVS